jgi:hypothetical protein
MAWTDPITKSPGQIWTAANWNTHGRDNLKAMMHLAYVKATEKDIVNSTSAVDLLNDEVTIAGGSVGATGAIRVVMVGDYLNNSGSGATLTLEIILGATSLWKSTSSSVSSSATRHILGFDFVIHARNATNSQFMMGTGTFGGLAATTGLGPIAGISPFAIASAGFSAVDMTADQTLVVKATHSVANALISARCEAADVLVRP